MKHLLFLVHRLPYPPNKGDKIRSYHLLAHLAERYRVHLGTFVDDADDWQHADFVRRLCVQSHIASLRPAWAKLRSIRALAQGRPMSLDCYRDAGMRAWVDRTLASYPISRVVVFSSAMAQYAEHIGGARRIIDFVDVDSDKWAQYADRKPWPFSWIYRREGRTLLRYERAIAQSFDASLFVSQAEADLFRQRAPESAARIGHFSNGVDTDFFSPERDYDSPYADGEAAIVFTGAMDYWPNVDAVQWFADAMLPAIRARNDKATFTIVGARPAEAVRALAARPGIRVTGTVPDIRPYLAHARVAVAPLRVARGIQNKVLEAMAMGKPVVASGPALEGIDVQPGTEALLAGHEQQFIDAVCALLSDPLPDIGRAARRKVLARYGWSGNLQGLDALLDAPRATDPAQPAAQLAAKAKRAVGGYA